MSPGIAAPSGPHGGVAAEATGASQPSGPEQPTGPALPTGPQPTGPAPVSDEQLVAIYRGVSTIAVVGASAKDGRPAHAIPAYLQSQGYRIIPVNPRGGQMFGEPARVSLREIDVPVDVVDVFRPPRDAESVAREAVAIGARVLWFQPGTHTPEAARLAAAAGLTVVTDQCMGAAHGRLGLGPGPTRPAAHQEAPNPQPRLSS